MVISLCKRTPNSSSQPVVSLLKAFKHLSCHFAQPARVPAPASAQPGFPPSLDPSSNAWRHDWISSRELSSAISPVRSASHQEHQTYKHTVAFEPYPFAEHVPGSAKSAIMMDGWTLHVRGGLWQRSPPALNIDTSNQRDCVQLETRDSTWDFQGET